MTVRSFLPALLGAALLAAPVVGQQEAATPPSPPPLVVETVTVTPERPAADTLYQLRVTLRNRGERIASQLAFRVTVAGQELPVYRNQLFMEAVPPGETFEVRLYNFWSSETGRAFPSDGRLPVEVALTEATWYSIRDVEEEGETIEEWSPLEPVAGLPSVRAVTLGAATAD